MAYVVVFRQLTHILVASNNNNNKNIVITYSVTSEHLDFNVLSLIFDL